MRGIQAVHKTGPISNIVPIDVESYQIQMKILTKTSYENKNWTEPSLNTNDSTQAHLVVAFDSSRESCELGFMQYFLSKHSCHAISVY